MRTMIFGTLRACALLVACLTLFNSQGSSDAARLTLSQYEDGKNDGWIDKNHVKKVNDPVGQV